MDFKQELAKYGYNKGNLIDVEALIDEILPALFAKNQQPPEITRNEEIMRLETLIESQEAQEKLGNLTDTGIAYLNG